MLLGRLFEKLFAGGLVLVATSNTPPDSLYHNGLNRELVLPFIDLLKRQCEIVELNGATDYRQQKFTGEAVFQFGPGADAAMDRLWLKLAGGDPGSPETLRSLGRDIPVPRAAMGAARFDFADLCDAPLGARDYLRIAQRYETVMLDHVPVFERTNPSAGKRFILLVDTLYDRRIKLAASFAAPLDALVEDDRQKPHFARALSRLAEMQSAEYLGSAHKAAHRPDSQSA
jgi:cell division protein ZapE